MIEETAIITDTRDDLAWVETERSTTCGSCAAHNACGSAVLARLLGRMRNRVRVLNGIQATVGDRVVIGIREDALVRGSIAMYAVPLAAMIGAALLGELLNDRVFGSDGEVITIVSAAVGLIAGFAWLRRFSKRIALDERFQPVILRRLNEHSIRVSEITGSHG